MKRCLSVILAIAFIPTAFAVAQQPSDTTKEDVQKLFDAMQAKKMFESVKGMMQRQVPVMVDAALKESIPDATTADKQQMNEFMAAEVTKVYDTMPTDELIQAMVPAYQHHFSHAEMQQLIDFYSTPVGKKSITEMPAVMQEFTQAGQPIMRKWLSGAMDGLKASAAANAKKLKDAKSSTPARPTKP